MLKTRISVPSRVRRGQLVEVKTLASHPMETGFRIDASGKAVPRNILVAFSFIYASRLVMRAELHPAVAANPYLAFNFRADHSGLLEFIWVDQYGVSTRETRELQIESDVEE